MATVESNMKEKRGQICWEIASEKGHPLVMTAIFVLKREGNSRLFLFLVNSSRSITFMAGYPASLGD